MASSLSLEEKFPQLLTLNAKKDAQLGYLRKQLEPPMRNNRRETESSHSPSESQSVDEESEGNPFAISDEDQERGPRRTRRGRPFYCLGFHVQKGMFPIKQI